MGSTPRGTAYTDLARDVIDIIAAMAPDRTVRVTEAVTLVDELGFDSARLLELSTVLERRFDCALDDQRMTAEQTVHDIVALVADATNTAAPRLYPAR
jgi:acyl carrier protein